MSVSVRDSDVNTGASSWRVRGAGTAGCSGGENIRGNAINRKSLTRNRIRPFQRSSAGGPIPRCLRQQASLWYGFQ